MCRWPSATAPDRAPSLCHRLGDAKRRGLAGSRAIRFPQGFAAGRAERMDPLLLRRGSRRSSTLGGRKRRRLGMSAAAPMDRALRRKVSPVRLPFQTERTKRLAWNALRRTRDRRDSGGGPTGPTARWGHPPERGSGTSRRGWSSFRRGPRAAISSLEANLGIAGLVLVECLAHG